MTTYIELGPGSSLSWGPAVATFASLPASDVTGRVRITLDTGAAYYWTGSAWSLVSADAATGSFTLSDILTVTNGTGAGVGTIGELLTASQASATTSNVGATGVWGYATSLSITAGSWFVTGNAAFNENGATLTTSLSGAISSSSSGAGLTAIDATISSALISGTSDATWPVPAVIVDISSTTTYYLNTRFFYTAGSPRHYGKILARRIR